MKTCFEEIQFSTDRKTQIMDFTAKVDDIVKKSKIRNGIAVIHVPHATCSVVLNEAENGLMSDLLKAAEKIVPDGNWEHNKIDNNAEAHIKSAILGSSVTIPIVTGTLVRGTWQNVLVVESDGPRKDRKLIVFVMGQ